MRCAVILGALAACTYPETEFRLPFACLEDPGPTTAPADVGLRGAVVDARTRAPLSGIQVSLLAENLGAIDGPERTGGTGGYDLSTPTGGSPVERVYLLAEGNSEYVTTYNANTRSLAEDLSSPLPMVSVANASTLAGLSIGASSFPADKGVVTMNIFDCNGARVPNATVSSTDPAQDIYYFAGVVPSKALTATDDFGVVMIANLTPGTTITLTVSASTDDGVMAYPARSLASVGGAFVQHDVTPFKP